MIPVFLCFDKSLQYYVSHVYNSVKLNTYDDIEFHVIITPDVSDICVQDYHRADIIVHRVDMPDINVNPNGIVRSPAMFLRWLIPSFTEHKRAIYLDNDVIVTGNIADMFNRRMGNNLISAVKDKWATCVCHTTHHQGTIPDALHLPSFYSGQLVINCEAWHAEGIADRLFDVVKQYNVLDMIALNYVCAGRITELAPEWCVSAAYDEVPRNAKLLHWHGRSKPWDTDCKNRAFYTQYNGGAQ